MLGCCGVLFLGVLALPAVLRLLITIWRKLIAPSLGLAIDLTKQGRWAVVTGATGGIGSSYAKAFAEKGLNVVLVGRCLEKLEELAEDMKNNCGVDTKIVEVDLAEGQSAYAKVAKAAEGLELAVVVNNAGVSYDHPEYFEKVTEEDISNILQVNVAAVTGIARALLPQMMERRKGVLINIGSLASMMPGHYLTIYTASKAYVDKLSENLAAEAAPKGVTVQCVQPGPVATRMTKLKRTSWMAPGPEKFVESALRTVGIESRTTGYLPHCLILGSEYGIRYICEKFSIWIVSKTMLKIRERALREKALGEAKETKEDTLDPDSLDAAGM